MFDRSPKLKAPSSAVARAPERAAAAPSAAEPAQGLASVPLDLGRIAFGTAGPDGRPKRRPNHVGLPPKLRAGVEALSGLAMDEVRVRYRSPEPARLGALAFARGRDIHLGPGQEEHLPHEAWHVVQQARGRVKPTIRTSTGSPINTDPALELDAHRMGDSASRTIAPERHLGTPGSSPDPMWSMGTMATVQMVTPWWKYALLAGTGAATAAVGAATALPALMAGGTVLAGGALAHGLYSSLTAEPQANYSQRSDPSFFGPHAPVNQTDPHSNFRGSEGMRKQMANQTPTPADIRAASNTNNRFPFQNAGNGEHEIVPTNIGDQLGSADHAMVGTQSGGRLSTGTAVLKPPGLDATGHTGTFSPGVTTGQKFAHDILRNLPTSATENEKLIDHTNTALTSLATGQQIMESDVLTGATPVHNAYGPLGVPLSHPLHNTQPPQQRQSRIAFAKDIHKRREHMKDRGRTLARSLGVPREPSPERELLKDDGTGGGYKKKWKRALWSRSKSPVPTFRNSHQAHTAPHEEYAHMAGWMTQPYRYGGTFRYMQHD